MGEVTDENEREAMIDLSFLPIGKKYEAIIYGDAKDTFWKNNSQSYSITTKKGTPKTKLKQKMVGCGGFAIHIKEI